MAIARTGYKNFGEFFDDEDELWEDYSEEVVHMERMAVKGKRSQKLARDKILWWRNMEWPSYKLLQLNQQLSNRRARSELRKLNYEARVTTELDMLDILPPRKSEKASWFYEIW